MTTQTPEKQKSFTERFTPRWISNAIKERKKQGWQNFIEKHKDNTNVTQINDCADQGAKLRLEARASEIIGTSAGFAEATTDLQAAGLLVDALSALDAAPHAKSKKHKNVFLVNVAPRNGEAKKHENGTPFCYFRYKGTLVVATVDGLTLSLLKKLKLIDSVQVVDIPTVLPILKKEGIISEEEVSQIAETQFRSYEFSPRLALYLSRRGEIQSKTKRIEDVKDAPLAAWYLDTFAKYGNVKTAILPEDVFSPDVVEQLQSGTSKKQIATLETKFGVLPVYRRLKDVEDNGKPAVIVGSSGIGNKKFLEIVVQGGNAAKQLGIGLGDLIVVR